MSPTRRTPGRDAVRDTTQWFPCSHDFRSTRAAPSYTPVTPAGTPQLLSLPADDHPWPGWPSDARTLKSTKRASHTDPYPPGSGSAPPNEASSTGSSRMPSRLARHAHNPSGSTGSPWLCQGRLPPNPSIPNKFGCPQLHSDHCDNPRIGVSHPHSENTRLTAHFQQVMNPAVQLEVAGGCGPARKARCGRDRRPPPAGRSPGSGR